ncbi:MAG: BCCT family transporter [Candidatus Cloacimonetes bacterium]|nr:BCCT family transporter [Candidatus Cloacimonadota bacterium]
MSKPKKNRRKKNLLAKDKLKPNHKLREKSKDLDSFRSELEDKYRRDEDQEIIDHKVKSFKQILLQRELAENNVDQTTIKKEEHLLIGKTLKVTWIVLAIFLLATLIKPDKVESIALSIKALMVYNLSWLFLGSTAFILVFLVYLASSRYGNIVLGDPKDKPEFSTMSWIAMLFSAGMGAGLVFWGAAEPMLHYVYPPLGDGRTHEAASKAMVYAAFHWGFHGWGIYTLCAVSVAYFGFRKRKKYLISSCIPVFVQNRDTHGLVKLCTDVTATLAVVFGVAASLGLGVKQICGGIGTVFEIDSTGTSFQLGVLAVVTVCFLLSACTGLSKGIQILSNLNIIMAICLMVFIFFVGPQIFSLNLFIDTIGNYIHNLIPLSFQMNPMSSKYVQWMGDWSILYLAWWIAWCPFVGIFLARISKGRTIREFIFGALVIPTVFTILWFSVFGGAAFQLDLLGNEDLAALMKQDVSKALFLLLTYYPMQFASSVLALFLIFVFLVTSADSATFVIAMMTSEGDLDPNITIKITWGVIITVITGALLVTGGIKSIQAVALIFSLPFIFVLLMMVMSLWMRLSTEVERKRL